MGNPVGGSSAGWCLVVVVGGSWEGDALLVCILPCMQCCGSPWLYFLLFCVVLRSSRKARGNLICCEAIWFSEDTEARTFAKAFNPAIASLKLCRLHFQHWGHCLGGQRSQTNKNKNICIRNETKPIKFALTARLLNLVKNGEEENKKESYSLWRTTSTDFCFTEKKKKEKHKVSTQGQRSPFQYRLAQSSSVCMAPACGRMRWHQGACRKSQALAVAPLFGHVETARSRSTLEDGVRQGNWTRVTSQFIAEKQVCHLLKESPKHRSHWEVGFFSFSFLALRVRGDYHVQFLWTSYEECNCVPASGALSKFYVLLDSTFLHVYGNQNQMSVHVWVCVNVRCYWPMRCVRVRSESNANGYLTSLTKTIANHLSSRSQQIIYFWSFPLIWEVACLVRFSLASVSG